MARAGHLGDDPDATRAPSRPVEWASLRLDSLRSLGSAPQQGARGSLGGARRSSQTHQREGEPLREGSGDVPPSTRRRDHSLPERRSYSRPASVAVTRTKCGHAESPDVSICPEIPRLRRRSDSRMGSRRSSDTPRTRRVVPRRQARILRHVHPRAPRRTQCGRCRAPTRPRSPALQAHLSGIHWKGLVDVAEDRRSRRERSVHARLDGREVAESEVCDASNRGACADHESGVRAAV